MQYYFHVRHNGDTASDTDPEGEEFPDMQAVRAEAHAAIREILSQSLQSGVESPRRGDDRQRSIWQDGSHDPVFHASADRLGRAEAFYQM